MASLHAASSNDGLFHECCKLIFSASKRWYVRHIILPLIVSAPPALILLVVSKEGVKAALPQPVINFVDNHPLILIGGVVLYPLLLKGLGALVEARAQPRRAVDTRDLVALLSVLEEAASVKMANALRAAKEPLVRRKFEQLVSHTFKPQEQYERLTSATYDFFSTIDTGSSYRVGLMRIQNGKPVSWSAYSPAGRVPRMTPADLGAPASCISRCIQTKSIVVVSDVVKEAAKKRKEDRRYVAGVTSGESGSQICMPVPNRETGAIDMVLCVAAGTAGAFDEGAARVYEQLLMPIVSRLQYEVCLENLLQRGVREEEKAA